jgi:hypothetical protein
VASTTGFSEGPEHAANIAAKGSKIRFIIVCFGKGTSNPLYLWRGFGARSHTTLPERP